MIKQKKFVSIILSILLVFSLFSNLLVTDNSGIAMVYADDSFQGPAGINFVSAGAYPVTESGLVYFAIEYKENTMGNPNYAYVTGSFNGWNQTQYKMEWQQDTDGTWKIMTSIPLNPGTYEYKFILHWDDAQVWINDTGWNASNSTFTLAGQTNINLSSSSNYVIPGKSVYFALDKTFSHGGGLPIEEDINWTVTTRSGVSINNSVLTVDEGTSVSSDETLTVTASYDGNSYTKNINLQPSHPNSQQRKVNYYRYDNTYTGQENTTDGVGNFDWNTFAWGDTSTEGSFDFSEDTDFGKACYIDTNDKFLVRKSLEVPSKWTNDWYEKTRTFDYPQINDTVYVIEGDSRLYTDFRKAMTARRPKALYAVMDTKDVIEATLTNEPVLPITDIKVYKTSQGTNTELPIKSIEYLNSKLTIILEDYAVYTTSDLIYFTNEQYAPSLINLRNVIDELSYYDGMDLGITYESYDIKARLWAPTASNIELLVYDTWNETTPVRTYNMTKSIDGTWLTSINKSQNDRKFYMYRLTFYNNTFFETTNYAVDPYAQAVSINGEKAAFVNLNDSDTKPSNWNPSSKPQMQNLEDAIIYELHIRDFSIGDDSGISQQNKGTYKAFTETTTTIPNSSTKTGLDSLVELGITHVQLLPFYDFNAVDETVSKINQDFNWGYAPQNYNVPEGAYSTDSYSPHIRIKETREMIQALHNYDIRAVMDVVYNHTHDTSVFEPIVPNYYYRTDSLGRFIDDSGCGNTVATERRMVRKYIIDSLKHWVNNYNLDGFRFDLMGLFDTDTMIEATNAVQQIDSTILMYGEPWGGFVAPWTGKGDQRGYGFGVFNDDFRNAIRGGNSLVPSSAYVTKGASYNTEGIWKGLRGSIDTFAQDPEETINYVSAHDNYTIWDQIVMALGEGETRRFFQMSDSGFPISQYYLDLYGYTKDEANPINTITEAVNGAEPYKWLDTSQAFMDHRVRRTVLASGIVLTSQGIPFIHAGEEHLRTKYGDHNSYKSPDIINNKDFWNRKEDNKWVFDYYAGLIKLRKEHPAFRMTSSAQINQHFEGLAGLAANVVGYKLKDNANGDSWKDIVIIYNPNDWNESISLPGTWNVVVNDQNSGTSLITTISNNVTVNGTSMMVLYSN